LINPHFNEAFYLFHVPVALGMGLLALASSILHLGRPHLAFRAVLGFKKSWLSREIIAFGLFAQLAILYALCYWFEPVEQIITVLFFGGKPFHILSLSVITTGVLGMLCSVMVYRDTKRPFWDNHLTTIKFLATSIILGFATIFLTSTVLGLVNPGISATYVSQYLGNIFCKVICITIAMKLLLEACIFLAHNKSGLSFFKKTAMLMGGPLKSYTLWRFACGIVGGILIPLMFLSMSQEVSLRTSLVFSLLIFGITLVGELLERYLFFRAVVPLKMPGGN